MPLNLAPCIPKDALLKGQCCKSAVGKSWKKISGRKLPADSSAYNEVLSDWQLRFCPRRTRCYWITF